MAPGKRKGSTLHTGKRKTDGVKPAVSWGVSAYVVTFIVTKFGLHLDPVLEQALNGIVAYAFSFLAPPAKTKAT